MRILLLLLLLASSSVAAQTDSARYIVVPESMSDSVKVEAYADSIDVVLVKKSTFYITWLDLNRAPLKIYQLYNHPLIARVELDVLIPLPRPDSVPSNALALGWGVDAIRANLVQVNGNTGEGVKVGIIDSGLDSDHPLLVNSIVGGFDATGNNNWEDNNSGCGGHGTHVGGIVLDVAPGAKLYALKVFPATGDCLAWASDQIEAINYAKANGIQVVNISIGGGSMLGSFISAIESYARQGGIVVAAAGNSGGAVQYPGGYTYAIGVGALANATTIASYSSRGPELDIAAPGSSIISAKVGGGTVSKSGTSMAAPHIAGVVALLKYRNPTLNVHDILTLMSLTSVDRGTAGRDNIYGWGRVDAFSLDSILAGNPGYNAPIVQFPIPSITHDWGSISTGFYIDSLLISSPSDAWSLFNITPMSGFTAFKRSHRYAVWNIDYSRIPRGTQLKLRLGF